MKWQARLGLAVRVVLHNLLGEEDNPPTEAKRIPVLLANSQAQLDGLYARLAEARAQEQRLELDWQAAQAQARGIEQAVDAALLAGQEDLARTSLEQGRRQQARVKELSESYHTSAQVTARLQETVETLQERLNEARRQYDTLAVQNDQTEALERLQQLERALHKETAAIQTNLSERREQLARRADQLQARAEWRHKT